jgi:hypothetical protein
MYIRPCLVPHPKIRQRKNPSTRRCNLCTAVVVAIMEHRRGTHTHTHTHVHTLDHPGLMGACARARTHTHTGSTSLCRLSLSLTHTYICKCDIIFVPSFFLLPDRSLSAVVTEVPVESPHRPPSLRRLTAFKLQVCRDGSISGTISAIISDTISGIN